MEITLGSLFDGIGVFPLAARHFHIRPLWASEIEKAPMSITRHHFPEMEHLGDIKRLDGGKIPPVHVLTFGSPCQNLSTMGAREGLLGSQSGLFYEAIRIIREMRRASHGVYPVIAVWENVAGAFTSGGGLDFRAVLESFRAASLPVPVSGKWASAGMVGGDGPDLCWRLMDAQYWGGARRLARRRRVFLVADFGGKRARKILFKPRELHTFSAACRTGGLQASRMDRILTAAPRGKVPVLHPFEERRMRQMAKEGNKEAFLASFGRPDDPFPTLLSKSVNVFSFWYEGEEKNGVVRHLTPLECERLLGLPDGWTACGADGEPISPAARCRAIGNSIALPCAEYIFAGIREALGGMDA